MLLDSWMDTPWVRTFHSKYTIDLQTISTPQCDYFLISKSISLINPTKLCHLVLQHLRQLFSISHSLIILFTKCSISEKHFTEVYMILVYFD